MYNLISKEKQSNKRNLFLSVSDNQRNSIESAISQTIVDSMGKDMQSMVDIMTKFILEGLINEGK